MANYWITVAVLTALALLTVGCALFSENVREEEIAIPPTQTEPDLDLGLGPGARPLSFGPGDKGSPRISPSGEKVAFVLDGYVVEKYLHTQDLRSRTAASDFDALSTEWLSDESLAILGPEDETRDGSVKAATVPSSLLVAYKEGSSSDGSSNVRRLPERVDAAGAAPGSQLVATAVSASPTTAESLEEPSSSRLMLLWGSGEPVKVYLGGIDGLVTGLSVSPDGRGVALAVRSGDEDDDPATRGEEPAPYFLYRVPEGSEPENSNTPEPVRSVGEGFIAASINVSPDGSRLAVVGAGTPAPHPTCVFLISPRTP